MDGPQRFPSEDLCWAVVRMATLMYPPHIIETCTGVSEPLGIEIMRRYYAMRQSRPAPDPYPAQQHGHNGYPLVVIPMPHSAPPQVHGHPIPHEPPQAPRLPPAVPLALPEPVPEPELKPKLEPELETRLVERSTEISAFHIEYLRHYVGLDPDVTLEKLCKVLSSIKVEVSQFKLLRALIQNGIKIKNTEDRPEPTKQARLDFSYLVGAFGVEQLVFVGQVGCDIRYGWCARGRTRRARTQKFTICFALSNSGTVTLRLLEEPATAETYQEFVDYTVDYIELLPREKSVLVLNNRLLKVDDPVVEKARSNGTPCLFLPRDSPDYNPIKQAVSAFKAGISKAQASLGEAEDTARIEAIIFYHVYESAQEHAEDWFRECGYT